MKSYRIKNICKKVTSSILVLLFVFSLTVNQVFAVSLPSWVYNAIFRVSVYGANYLASNTNLKDFTIKTYDSHAWDADLGSIKFNNKSANTGSASGYKTNIATTWSQSRTRTNVFMSGTKRSFTTGSNYLALQVVTPTGVINDLERIPSGSSRLYEAYGNKKVLGTYDFRFIYTDSETWDLKVTFNDRFYPDVPVDTQSLGGYSELENIDQSVPSRVYRLPSVSTQTMDTQSSFNYTAPLTLQGLIDEKTDPISGEEIDIVRHFDNGDVVAFRDVIKSIRYNSDRNVTEFKFESTSEESRALQFYGDLTNNYSVGSYMQLTFNVVELGSVDGIAMESFDYLEDYNYDGDAAPHIDSYL